MRKSRYATGYNGLLLTDLKKARLVAIDTETKSLEDKTLVGFSIAYDKETVMYVPVRDKVLNNMPLEEAKNLLQFIIDNCIVVFHNSSFDLPTLYKFGIDISKCYSIHDTLIMANIINENMRHGLKSLVKKYFNYTMTEYKEICGTGLKQIPFSKAPKNKVKYACDDAYYTLKLYSLLETELLKDREIEYVYTKIERPLLHVIANMHSNGIMIDAKKVYELTEYCKKKVELNETKLKLLIGDINFNSSKQLKEYFIDKRNMPVIKQSKKTGAPSVDKEVLEKYAEDNAEAKLLLEYRKYNKILTTFMPALKPVKWDLKTYRGKIYPSFNQSGTVSGRFSSSRPNMQNIPRADKLGIRQAIVADDGHILIGADYSQIELRVLAHFSKDLNLMKAYAEKKDIHQMTADACGIGRQEAKTVNFGLVYGMRNKTLAKQIKVSATEAQQYIDRYFNMYPGVKEFWQQSEEQFINQGYVKTWSGRKRRRSQFFSTKDDFEKGGEIRSAINAIIQGSAADLIKMAMVLMYSRLKEFDARIISTVHDEVIVSCPVKYANSCFTIVKSSMLKAGKNLSVPVEVDCKFGRTWEEAHSKGIDLKEVNNDT